MITLRLPYPVSANRYWRSFWHGGCAQPVTAVSDEARAYRCEVKRLAREAGVKTPLQGRVRVSYVLYPKRPADWKRRCCADPAYWDDSVRCIDLDNAQKVLLDALEGVVFEDDARVWRIEGRRAVPDGEARVELQVEQLDAEAMPDVPASGGMQEKTVLPDGPSDASQFPIGCRVRTPTGRIAEVCRCLAGASKYDHFDRVMCRYVDGTRANDLVTLQPRFLTRID